MLKLPVRADEWYIKADEVSLGRAHRRPCFFLLSYLLNAFFHELSDWLFIRLFLFALASWIINRPR